MADDQLESFKTSSSVGLFHTQKTFSTYTTCPFHSKTTIARFLTGRILGWFFSNQFKEKVISRPRGKGIKPDRFFALLPIRSLRFGRFEYGSLQRLKRTHTDMEKESIYAERSRSTKKKKRLYYGP